MERLLEYFKPENYDLELFIFSAKETIQGAVTVNGVLAGDVVKFHAVNMNIKEVTFQALHWHSSDVTPVRPCTYNYDGEILEIALDDMMKKDLDQVHQVNLDEDYEDQRLATFIIKYETKLNHNMQGCYVSTYEFNGEPQKLIATQFESHYAREAFPCIDEPAAKASFALTLVVPDYKPTDVVLTNTELIKQDINRFEFAPTPRMSTYLLAWVVGPLKSISAVNNHGVKVASYCALNQSNSSLEFANEVACRALDYYDDTFGIKYPLTKLDQVALPDFEAGAMENWGLVTYRESCMLAESDASVDTKQSVAVTVTHELSHQWFGDLVTMKWWDDLWLNESFATVMEYYATEALYPELHVWQDFYAGDCVAALRRDCLPGVQAVQQEVHNPAEIATLFDGAIVYAKGARLVLMLMRLMGEDKFYQGVHEYFEKYQYNNTVGDDLWSCLQPYADFNIKEFMHAWISQPGYPVVWREDDKIHQQRFLIDGTTDSSTWPLPKIKDDMSGHYLLKLDDHEFQQKIHHYDTLSNEQKLRLLIDRMLLAKTCAVTPASLLEILPKFVQEDAPVWDILLSIINDLKIFFPDESDIEQAYRTFLQKLVHSRLSRIGILSSSQDDTNQKRLRKILLVIARFARDQTVISTLAQEYRDNLSSIDAEIRSNVLMAKMMCDEDTTFAELLSRYQTEDDPELKDDILGTLAIVKHPQNLQTCIKLLKQPEIVRPQDHLYLYIYLLRNPKARTQALSWLYDNWGYVEQLTGEKSIEDYPRCMSSYIKTRAEADQFYQFFEQQKDNPVLKRTLVMARSSIESRLALVAQASAAVQAKLSELMGK